MRRSFSIEKEKGKTYWYSTVTGEVKDGFWEFRCDCGKTFFEYPGRVIGGYVRSCGCKKISRNSCHSQKHKLYGTWKSMMARCYNPKHDSFKNYGAKGVYVCEEWHRSAPFLAWADKTYIEQSPRLTLERIDNSKPYSPDNCCWKSRKEQTRHRSTTILWEINGETKPLAEWCEIYEIDYSVVNSRYNVCKWDKIKCLTEPVKRSY